MNVGIVGCGRVTTLRHLPALDRVAEARVVALADTDDRRLAEVARAHGIDRRFASHDELVADASVDAVAVCVPASLHADVAVTALEAGKHVLIEKPLALGLEDADRIRDAARRRTAAAVVVGLNMRRHRLVRRARDLVRAGALGEVQAIRTVFTSSFDYRDVAHPWRFRRETGGGALVEMGPHHLDLWRFVTGREVEQVFASSRSERDEDETVLLAGVLTGGVRANTLVSQRSANVNELEVFGDRGRVRVSCYRYDGFELQLGRGFAGDVRHRVAGLARRLLDIPRAVRSVRGASDYVDSYTAQWEHFVAAACGRVPPEPDLADGVKNVEVLVAARESLESGSFAAVRRIPAGVAA